MVINMDKKAVFPNIRDPFILVYEGRYYLYGTRSETTWGLADGFDCYVSNDLRNWTMIPYIFRNDGTFWADRSYWAPECYEMDGKFYLVASFRSEERTLGIQILRSDSPEGPFVPFSDGPVTPEDMPCLDGTVFYEDGTPWLVYSRSFEKDPDGIMCALPLTSDWHSAAGDPISLFSAKEAPWVIPFPFASEEFGRDDDMYLSDGPAIHTMKDGSLLMLWSSFGSKGYTVGMSKSPSGRLAGPWEHLPQPLFDGDGGHGMLFMSTEGKMLYTLHSPNTKGEETPVFVPVREENGQLVID